MIACAFVLKECLSWWTAPQESPVGLVNMPKILWISMLL